MWLFYVNPHSQGKNEMLRASGGMRLPIKCVYYSLIW